MQGNGVTGPYCGKRVRGASRGITVIGVPRVKRDRRNAVFVGISAVTGGLCGPDSSVTNLPTTGSPVVVSSVALRSGFDWNGAVTGFVGSRVNVVPKAAETMLTVPVAVTPV